jgi:hypothetical protein
MDRGLDYAGSDGKYQCINDGFQFHLTGLQSSGSSGKLNSPYDHGLHSTYRLGKEPEDIKQYTIWLTINGNLQDAVEAEVWHYYEGDAVSLAWRPSQQMLLGDKFYLTGSLPRMLTIQRAGQCVYKFMYADPAVDGIWYFEFDTNSGGYGSYSRKPEKNEPPLNLLVPYFKKFTGKVSTEPVIECTFPGW